MKTVDTYLNMDTSYQVIIGITALFFTISLYFFCYVLILRSIKNKRTVKVAKLKDKYEILLAKILFEEDHARDTVHYKRIVNLLSYKKLRKLNRKILVDVLKELHQTMTGEAEIVLNNFYKDIGFHTQAINRLDKSKWHVKCAYIDQLAQFKVKEGYEEIAKYTDSPNTVLRMEAQYASISIKGPSGLEFLRTLKRPITEWQQIRILERLKTIERLSIPNFADWLNTDNDSVKIFLTKLIDKYNQLDSAQAVLALLNDENEELVEASIKCLTGLQYSDALEDIKLHYTKFSMEGKLAAVNAVSQMGSEVDEAFLTDIIKNETYDLQIAAGQAMRNLFMIEELENLKKTLPEEYTPLLVHALDERI